MRRLTVPLLLALLAFSFGCIAAFFWHSYHPVSDDHSDGLPAYTLTAGIISFFVAVPGLISWLERHPGEESGKTQDAEWRDDT